ncbi:hypothetical protein AB7M49_005922 [Bradyrhizobium elkanii]|uniref:hypothetical protein n=1 Tax=Bradyrhizobium TaxID=374 RepID=UPI000571C248|nr:hypothetical protein [Bradyrhizobium elkanii]MCP1968267.1 hypothetical protein [Bradyrhizobium elkanii]MCS4110233.1 hypothetical protein [Bradyrhizobium elkanii]ODM84428.1 hypothetical protein A6452_17010 [Bradyrhizobium elkanii]ODM86378.1 hypothetical protein A6X20_01720 [Bradyrhizobium elkanii]WLA86049.1 hypothetical protein QNJ99_18780 [Bradyrhizobium elkanii]
MKISTRALVIATIIFNCISIGLSEVQRRQLGATATEAMLELRKIEKMRLDQQAVELDRTYKLIAEINARVNNVEVQMQSFQKPQAINVAK